MSPPKLSPKEIARLLPQVPHWSLTSDGAGLRRNLRFSNYAKAVHATHLAMFLADQGNHHPDLQMGWGYCALTFTTHDAGGLTQTDFDAARRFDAVFAGSEDTG